MPELPEVETTRAGISPHIVNTRIESLRLHRRDLRWPVRPDLPGLVQGQRVAAVLRRGKFLILDLEQGALILHLGMSGSIRVTIPREQRRKHDHWEMLMVNGHVIRFNDPRRFGCLLWSAENWREHELLTGLGPEPLDVAFDAAYLHSVSRRRRVAVKALIMNSRIVVGVGNIYATEALFRAGIRPSAMAGRLSYRRCEKLVAEIKSVLSEAIESGGTTLRDYLNGQDRPGYFQQSLWVYGRGGQHCKRCGTRLKSTKLGQRATVYCHQCQKH